MHFFSLSLLLVGISFVNADDFYSFSVLNPQKEKVSLEKYRGKVSLVVNVASLCGFTEATYRSLTRLHDILSYDGFFTVLAFPCNQFGDQEPEDATTIVENVMEEYGTEFPIFDKIDVFGENASPAFRNLVEQSSKEPEWNFYKYLVGPDGEVINAWGTRDDIEDIFSEIQEAAEHAKKDAKSSGKTASKETIPEQPEELKVEL